MNSYTINLSSNSTNYQTINPELDLDDHSNIILNLSGVFGGLLPIYMTIDWGDGSVDSIDGLVFSERPSSGVFDNNTLLNTTYNHDYYPSPTTLYKNLSAQVLISYIDGNFSFFVIPIQIRTFDYFESMYDMRLKSTSILPLENNPKEHQFEIEKGGYLIELHNN